jgi:hypothetical protein
MTGSTSLFDLLLLAISVYVLYAGITGKGRLYTIENIKEGKETEFKALMRKLYIVLGILMTINSGASLLKGMYYTYQETVAATDTTGAVYEWVMTKDLGAFSFMTARAFDIVSWVALAFTLALIVVLVVFMRRYTDKEKEAAKKSGGSAGSAACARKGGCVLPSSAFEFEEDDKTSGSDKQ